MKYIFLFIISLIFILGCQQTDQFSDIPEIEFDRLSKDTIIQGRVINDSLFIYLNFKDGDGDIGFEDNSANIYLKDSRDGFIKEYASPVIPISGATNGVEGTIKILVTTLFNICCIYDTGQDPCTRSTAQPTNEFKYSIFIEDRAGNQSNEVETSMLTLLCQ